MKKILLTDDDRFTANIWRRKFEDAGYQVSLAHDGHEAIEKLVLQPPDVLLLDLMLPEIDGVGVLRFLRSRPRLIGLPVVIVSNSTYFSGPVQAAWHAGATHFFNKSETSPDLLVQEVVRIMEAGDPPPPAAAAPPPFAPHGSQVLSSKQPPPLPNASPAFQFGKPMDSAVPSARPPIPNAPTRVLVADDDPLIHGVLSYFLKEAGFMVVPATNGRQALEIASACPPELLVLDAMMPELTGFEVLRHWHRTPALANIPVIMLTAEKDQARMAEALGSGAVAYITKPFSPQDIVKRAVQLTAG